MYRRDARPDDRALPQVGLDARDVFIAYHNLEGVIAGSPRLPGTHSGARSFMQSLGDFSRDTETCVLTHMCRPSRWQVLLLRRMRSSRATVRWCQMKMTAQRGMVLRCLMETMRARTVQMLEAQRRGLNRSAWPLVPGLRLQAAPVPQQFCQAGCSRAPVLMQSCRLLPQGTCLKGRSMPRFCISDGWYAQLDWQLDLSAVRNSRGLPVSCTCSS